jgi:hypothetical protein
MHDDHDDDGSCKDTHWWPDSGTDRVLFVLGVLFYCLLFVFALVRFLRLRAPAHQAAGAFSLFFGLAFPPLWLVPIVLAHGVRQPRPPPPPPQSVVLQLDSRDEEKTHFEKKE